MMTPPADTPGAGPAGNAADSTPAKPLAWTIMGWVAGAAVPCLLMGGALLAQWLGSQAPSRAAGNVEAFVFGIFASLAVWALAIHLTVRRRMPAARWVGGAFITLPILFGVLSIWDGLSHGELNDLGTLLALGGILVFTLLACVWLHAFVFAPKVRRYLGQA